MSFALDVGTDRFRSLRRQDHQLRGRSIRAVYCAIADRPSHRRIVQRMGVPLATCEGELIVIGDAASDISELLSIPCIPLLAGGIVPDDDAPARQVIASLIGSALPRATAPRELCCVSLPIGSSVGAEPNLTHEFLLRVVRLRGYTPIVLNAATAIVLAEMSDAAFTSVGLAFGATASSLAVVHRGAEIAHCRIGVGGDHIDEEIARKYNQYVCDAAGNRYLDRPAVRGWKESISGSILKPADDRGQALSVQYRRLLTQLIDDAAQQISSIAEAGRIPQPLVVAAAGGPTRIPGFAELLEQCFRTTPFPLEVAGIRVTGSPYAVARGCLIRGELEDAARLTHGVAA